MKFSRLIFILLGFICLGLGTAGVFLPILPTVPFYMATVFFFGKSSKKLDSWFKGTELYKKHLESFVQKKAMLMKTKLSILTMVTLVMGFGFIMMKGLMVPRIILAIVWISHVVYFLFGIKTIKEGEIDISKEEKSKKVCEKNI